MSLLDMPVFSALTEKMRWHQTRQGLLAENVANSETPGYRGRDLAQYEFRPGASSHATVTTATTQRMHIAASSSDAAGGFGARRMNSFEITPEGNGVTLEDEMMKVSTNLMDYQAVTSLYQKSIKILRSALGRSA
jgi:flagellar basal-body rod protein FlgB